jgi:hypothetical protein
MRGMATMQDKSDNMRWHTHMGREQQGPSTTQAVDHGKDQARPWEQGKETSGGTRENSSKRRWGDNNQKTPHSGEEEDMDNPWLGGGTTPMLGMATVATGQPSTTNNNKKRTTVRDDKDSNHHQDMRMMGWTRCSMTCTQAREKQHAQGAAQAEEVPCAGEVAHIQQACCTETVGFFCLYLLPPLQKGAALQII